MSERQLPEILHCDTTVQTRLFRVESLHLRFHNGVERHYERLRAGQRGAVMIIPMLDHDTVILTREYAAGVERYEVALPKGMIEENETVFAAANRELQEETGYGARRFTEMKSLTLSPSYMSHRIHVVLAEDLYPSRLPGDEPETIDVIPWQMEQLDQLFARDDVSEARSIAALLMLQAKRRSETR